jgi:RNA 2',3'-cyclic 3'-phosphodiesterase
LRLFIALDFPQAIRETLRDSMARLKPFSRAARWVGPEGMHITLKFIGETDSQKVDSLRAALGTIHSPQPIEMHFRGLGFFPDERKPRVLWCGLESSSSLAELATAIECALEPLGFPREGREFVPHLTLARFPSPQGIAEIVRAANVLKTQNFGSARETQFHLIESILKPSGAEYNRLASFAFVKGAE